MCRRSAVVRPGLLWWRTQQLVLDVSELDTRKEVILEAMYRYNPAAVADAEVATRANCGASSAQTHAARPRLPMAETITFGAQCIRAEAASLLADCRQMWSAAVAAWHRLAPRVRREARLVMLGAAIVQRTTARYAQQLALILRDMATANLARGHRGVRVAAVVIRHRFVRSV